MLNDERQIHDYLLGRTSEDQSAAIETQVLSDEESYLTLRSIEDDLLDAFARGELSAPDREAFLERYGAQPERLTFARALAGRTSNVVSFSRRRWVGWAAAVAAAVIVAIVVWAPQPGSMPGMSAPRQVAPAVRSIAVTFALEDSRGAEAPLQIAVPAGVSTVNLRVRLNPYDRFDRYSAELRDRGTVWRNDNLHASLEGGDWILSASVPASVLRSGSYELAVSGGNEDLGFITLEVRHNR